MRTQVIAAVLLAVIFEGCSHCYHVSQVQNVPLFQEEKEVQISGSFGMGEYTTSWEAQLAGSPARHLGIMGSFMYAHGGNVSGNNYGNGFSLEAATGYYKPIRKYAVFEIYGGAGYCIQHHEYSDFFDSSSAGSADLQSGKLFLQPSFGFTARIIDIAVSTRLSSVGFFGMSGIMDEKLVYLSTNRLTLFEPAITLRLGGEHVKVQAQFISSNLLNNDTYFLNEAFHISLGLHIGFSGK